MSTKSTQAQIEEAFQQARMALPPAGVAPLISYLELLIRWNTRVNLTAVRRPEDIICRHLVECAFLAQRIPQDVKNLMDYGSGAGLPGIIVAICRPEIRVTLAEAHGKKAAFLREATRSVGLTSEVYEGRVEAMPSNRTFDAIAMRAVEQMEEAIPIALPHVERYLALLTTDRLAAGYRERFRELEWQADIPLPNTERAVLAVAVPRGTTSQ